MKKHIELLAILHIVYNVVSFLIGAGFFFLFSGIGIISQNEIAFGVLGLIGFILGGFFITLSIPGLIAGIGLLKLRPWARILAIIMACINTLNIPIGTALAVYTFWVLVNDEAIKEFSSIPPVGTTSN
jgi:hypothetical protein